MKKVEILKVIRRTAVGFHSWCESNVGIIRKENKNINLPIKEDKVSVIVELPSEEKKKKWWKRLLLWVKKIFTG